MENIISFKSSYGWISAKERNNRITSLSFGKLQQRSTSIYLEALRKNIIDYFLGKKIIFKNPLHLSGSLLQIKIWNEIQKIPYGETKSYGDIAKKIKTSPRFVGNTCAKNKHLLIIPCHRVLRSDGQLGGYSAIGGIKLKEKLLNMESI